METLQITKEAAIKAYSEASKTHRALLEGLFGKSVFIGDIKDRIKSYEDACEALGIDPVELSDFAFLSDEDQEYQYYSHRVTTIIKALNEGWVPNWNDSNEPKYYVWYRWGSSGAGFSYLVCGCGIVGSGVGSRLHFKSSELAEYFAKQFISELNKYFTL